MELFIVLVLVVMKDQIVRMPVVHAQLLVLVDTTAMLVKMGEL